MYVESPECSRRSLRTENLSIQFVDGWAAACAFRIPEAFRDAFDIRYAELVDRKKTAALRDKISQEKGYGPYQELARRIPNGVERRKIRDDLNHYKIVRQTWTQGAPPAYRFKRGDTFSSQDMAHTLQVESVQPTGNLLVILYRHDSAAPQAVKSYECSQADFAGMLQRGLPREVCRPAATPNREDLIARLREARDNGEVLTIIYMGGAHPGARRDIFPLRVETDRVLARSFADSPVKCYLFKKIVLPPESTLAT